MPGNIYKRGNTYWGRIWVNRKELRRSLHTASEAEARAALERWRAEVEAGGPAGRVTYQQAVVEWNALLQGDESLKPKTRERYLTSLRSLDEFFGACAIDEINRRLIGQYVASRRKKVTNATIRRDLTALSSVLRSAVAMGFIDENPARQWDRSVIRERKKSQHPPLLEEIEAIASRVSPAFAGLIRFAALTGCRMNEVAGLEWRDLRLDKGEAVLSRTKSGRARVIALRSPGGDATGTVTGTARHIRSPLVFWHGDGLRYANPSGLFRKAVVEHIAENEGFQRFRFHDLRHAFALRWLQEGGGIYELSKHLGHTSVKTTEIYLQWAGRHSERHMESGSEERRTA